jgi:peroxiredoxin Q/BCP
MASKLTSGDRAPAFHLTDQHGDKHRLSEFKGRKVMLFFYPKANTGGCTNQACGLRDVADEIGDTVILGISPDEPAKQLAWEEKHSLGFGLLSDPDHAVADKYGVWGEKKLYGKTYMGRPSRRADTGATVAWVPTVRGPQWLPVPLRVEFGQPGLELLVG